MVVSNTTLVQSHESDQALKNGISSDNIAPNSELAHTSLSNSDVTSIALRKGKKTCTQHPIKRFVSYKKLSQKYKTFVATLDKINIPKNIQEALQQTKSTATVTEEIKALIKNNTWQINVLLEGKKQVRCKWIFSIKLESEYEFILWFERLT